MDIDNFLLNLEELFDFYVCLQCKRSWQFLLDARPFCSIGCEAVRKLCCKAANFLASN
jgi:hypothetical protein